MQEMQIVRWCDWHFLRDGEKTSASHTIPLALGDEKADVDFCPGCDESVLGPIRDILRAIGSRTERPKAKESGATGDDRPAAALSQCPMCKSWMDNRSRLKHVENKHPELTPGQVNWRYGEGVGQVWSCNCGLTFPALRGRDMHVRRQALPGCATPVPDVPQAATRPDDH